MLFDVAAEMLEKLEQEFQEADPAEKEHFVKCSLSLLKSILGDAEKLM